MYKRSDLLGYDVSAAPIDEIVEQSWRLIEGRTPGNYVACANPHSLAVADSDAEFSAALKNACVLLPDGIGIVLARRFLGRLDTGRIAGSDYFRALSLSAKERQSLRYYFLGSSEQTLGQIRQKMAADYPWIEIVGTYSPPFVEQFSALENERMVAAINNARADVVWVGMTAPKQEKWIYSQREQIGAPLLGAIGAVFDFVAGTRKRPEWACRLGLEWLVRLCQEPRRLWRRNIVSAPLFVRRVLAEKLAPKRL